MSSSNTKNMKILLIPSLHLIFGIMACGCFIARNYGCNCTSKTLLCERSTVSVDTALPGFVPTDMQEIIMKRVWVSEAIELTSKHFSSLNRLRRIDFSENRISEVHATTFRDLEELEYVNLSYNRLKLFDPDTFSGRFPSFEELDLSHNRLLVLRDRNFHSLSTMRRLDLRGNAILYLSSGAFIGLANLERLSFSRANFTQFPIEALTIPQKIQFVELKKMPLLSTIPNGAFRKNVHLKTLILDEIALSTGLIPEDAFDGQHNLTNLALKSCNLTSVPRTALGRLKNLLKLDLSNNPIQIIHPGDFTSLTKLRKLILHRNLLMEIKVEAFSAQKLMNYIDLSNNILKTLYRQSFTSNLSSLKGLIMANNLWSCDCSLEWIIKAAIYTGDETVTCSKGFTVQTLSEMKQATSAQQPTCAKPRGLDRAEEVRTAYIGEEVVLPCRYNISNRDGHFTTFTWYRNDTILPVQTVDRDNASGLILKDAQLTDSGKYKCMIRSAGGKVSFTVYLKVMIPVYGDCCVPRQGNVLDIVIEPTTNCRTSAASSTVLVGVLAFVTALAITAIFVFIGRWWNKRKEDENTRHVATAEMRNKGTVFHRIEKQKPNGEARERGVVMGGQGTYSKPLHDIDSRATRPTTN